MARRQQSISSSSDLSHLASSSAATNDDHGEVEDLGTTASSETSSVDFTRHHKGRGSYELREASHDTDTFIDHGSKFVVDCTKDIFASLEQVRAARAQDAVKVDRDSDGSFIFMHNRKKCDTEQRDSLKYYSKPVRLVIDRTNQCGNRAESIVHTSTAQLVIGGGKIGVTSGTDALKPGRKVSDLTNLLSKEEDDVNECTADDSTAMSTGGTAETMHGDGRHSMPTLFVGNRFNCSSLTEVYIPSYREKKDALSVDDMNSDDCMDATSMGGTDLVDCGSSRSIATTHSSCMDIPAIIPAPTDMTAELLYNMDVTDTDRQRGDSVRSPDNASKYVIKPPSMFETASRASSNSDLMAASGAQADDKKIVMRRNSGENKSNETKNKRCISYHYINMHGDEKQLRPKLNIGDTIGSSGVKSHSKKCECCASSRCPSPRSSDSGMAGSCTISSPDAPIKLFDPDYEHFHNLEFADADGDADDADVTAPKFHALLHSQSSHNFGRFHDMSFRADNNHDSGQYGHSSLAPEDAAADPEESDINNMFELSISRDTVKRQSRCHSAERALEPSAVAHDTNRRLIFKTGLYAHWWKKEVMPGAVLRDIHNLAHPHQRHTKSSSAARSGGSSKPRIGWNIEQPEGRGSGKTLFYARALLSFSVFFLFLFFFSFCVIILNLVFGL